jgi:ribonucleoside-diphosphate reductase alpha chain
MATGLAYDSDGGSRAGRVDHLLMTGTAYKRSAELAGVVGPYDGYARNADAHKRVMRKHAAANDSSARIARHGLRRPALATKAWGGVKLGEKNGWRNARPRSWPRPAPSAS